jgi:alpha-tubulin suppressor-like RCC1 family protein
MPRCIQIESSYTKHYFLFDDGGIHSTGSNTVGQNGIGVTTTFVMPARVMISQNTRFKKVSTGNNGSTGGSNTHHVLALDEDGNVWSWGYNNTGQLGTGDNGNRYVPYRIPKEYFGNQRIVDIYAGGQDTGCSYARTEQGQLYSWGANGVGQLGLGDTTNRWRPNLIAAFDPAANNGIVKAQATGEGAQASFYVLDGNGYMWHAGYNGYGQGIDNTIVNHLSLTRSTQSPTAGATSNFWAFTNATYTGVWMRVSNGNTYFCGYNSGGTYYAGTGTNTNCQVPTLVYNATFVREMWSVTDYTTSTHRTMWLTENGSMWAAGYINFRWQSNTLAASNTGTIEDGTNIRPYRVAIPAGTKVQSMWMCSADETSNAFGPFVLAATDNGQLWFAGPTQPANGYAWLGGQRYIINSAHNWLPLTKGR